MLLYFIADLMRNSDLQQSFSRDQDATMQQARLSPEAREAMNSGNRHKVLQILGAELQKTELFGAVWIKGGVTISSVSPKQGAAGSQVRLEIRGDFFASGAFVTLQKDDVNYLASTLEVTHQNEKNSFLVATLNIPASASPGPYAVSVSNPDAWYAIQDNAFTITQG
jgi:hypothetical protein